MKPYSWWSAMKHFQAHQEPLCSIGIRDHLHHPMSESLLRKCRLSSCNHCTDKNSVYLKLVGCCLSVCVDLCTGHNRLGTIAGWPGWSKGSKAPSSTDLICWVEMMVKAKLKTPDLAHAWLTDKSPTCHVDAMARSKAIFINSYLSST